MTRLGSQLILSGMGMLVCIWHWPVDLMAEEPLMGYWRNFPVAHGTPLEPLPPKEELLKVVPPLRDPPTFNQEHQDLGVAPWWADYSELLFSEQPPRAADLARKPFIRTTAGEDEPLVLGLWSIKHTGTITLSVKKSPFPVTIRRVEFAPRYVPTSYRGVNVDGGRIIGFATYMPESGTGEIKPGENIVFWINVTVPPGTKPGRFEISFELIIHQVKVVVFPATVEVLPFDLPRADIAYGMYFRPLGGKVAPRYRTPELMRAYWRDMARHGMTSATMYMYMQWVDSHAGAHTEDVMRGRCFIDKDGNLKPLEGHLGIKRLEEMKKDGLIWPDIPIMLLPTDSYSKNPKVAGVIRDEMKKRGLPELLLYGADEPKVNEEAKSSFEKLQPVRPYFRVITAISDHAATAYADLIDIWVVNGGRITPEIRKLAKAKGAEVWTYDFNHRGRGNSTRARFYAGLYTWALELKGNFHWCYTEDYAWEGDRNAIMNFVLPSDKGPVPSVAWEARREGVEDYRLLKLLESRITAKPDADGAKEAGKWLKEIRSRVNWDLIQAMPKAVYPWDDGEIYPMCPNFEPAELSKIRSRVINLILKLR